MEGAYKENYAFVGEWYDNQASLFRRFNLFYYPTDDTLEMFDLKNRKTFMRRIKVNGVTLDSFYIGGTINIMGRLIKIIDFACENTRNLLGKNMEFAFFLVKPMPNLTVGKIITHLFKHGFKVTRMKKAKLTADDVIYIYRHMHNQPTYPFVLEHLTNSYIYGMEIVGKDIFNVIGKVLGDKEPANAEPGTIRALYGLDAVRNCAHVSSDPKIAQEDLDYFFPPAAMRSLRLRLTATLSNCTLCLLKPHAVREGLLGATFEAIDEGGFNITALNMLVVEKVNAAEFYEVYKGIVQEYKGMVEELASGPCVAMEIVAKDKTLNTAIEFRKLVGPADPEIARLLRPHTMRARLGTNKVKNAIHCSDLSEDGLLEVEYFFKILDL